MGMAEYLAQLRARKESEAQLAEIMRDPPIDYEREAEVLRRFPLAPDHDEIVVDGEVVNKAKYEREGVEASRVEAGVLRTSRASSSKVSDDDMLTDPLAVREPPSVGALVYWYDEGGFYHPARLTSIEDGVGVIEYGSGGKEQRKRMLLNDLFRPEEKRWRQ